MKKKNIIIFRADGPLKNTYLTDKLKKLNYKIKNYPILTVKKIYSKDKTLFHTRDGSYILKKNKKLFSNNLSHAYPDKKNRKKVIRNFIDSIKNSNVKKIISHKEIFDLMSICFAADKSLKLNREIKINYKI